MALSGWPSLTDDSGDKRSGTVFNKAFFDSIKASVEAALDNASYIPQFDGLVVGFAGAGAADEIQVGDANFKLDFDNGGASVPGLQFDSGDRYYYNRTTNTHTFQVGSATEMSLDGSGLQITDGLVVGFSSSPVADQILLGDANLILGWSSTIPFLQFDANDQFRYTRATNLFEWLIGSSAELVLDATSFRARAGDSSSTVIVGGVLNVDSAQHANSGVGETTLSSYTLPASALDRNDKLLRIIVWGSFAANGNTKTIKIKFGATSHTVNSSAISGGTWHITFYLVRTGAATQKTAWAFLAPALAGSGSGAPTETLSGTVAIVTTGQGGASSDILQEGFLVEAVG